MKADSSPECWDRASALLMVARCCPRNPKWRCSSAAILSSPDSARLPGTPGAGIRRRPPLSLAGVFFGNRPATQVFAASQSWFATTPPASQGPVNVKIAAADGGIVLLPEGYSYGPNIVELVTNAATAEGGVTGTLFGYGLTNLSGDVAAADLQMTVGGNPATITSVPGRLPCPLPCLSKRCSL